MSKQPEISALHAELLARLQAVRRREHVVDLAHGLLAAALIILLLTLLIIVLEQIFSFGTLVRTILFAIGAAGVAGSLAWSVGRPILRMMGIIRGENNEETATRVGRHFAAVRDRLLD